MGKKQYIKAKINEISKERCVVKVKLQGIENFFLKGENYRDINNLINCQNLEGQTCQLRDQNIFIYFDDKEDNNKMDFEFIDCNHAYEVKDKVLQSLIINIFNSNCAYIFIIKDEAIIAVGKCN